jgi:hypothetical protein
LSSLTETNLCVGKRGCDFLIAFRHVNGPSNWWGVDCLKCLTVFESFRAMVFDHNHACLSSQTLTSDCCSSTPGYVSSFQKYYGIFPSEVEKSPTSIVKLFRVLSDQDLTASYLPAYTLLTSPCFKCSFCNKVFQNPRAATSHCKDHSNIGTNLSLCIHIVYWG